MLTDPALMLIMRGTSAHLQLLLLLLFLLSRGIASLSVFRAGVLHAE
jgi:hypothetical protein